MMYENKLHSLSDDEIDRLYAAVEERNNDPRLDLDESGELNKLDVEFLVKSILRTSFGDANTDGHFDSRDLVIIFIAGQYEDDESNNSTWETGDWNGDGEFDSADLVLAFQDIRHNV